MTKFEFLGPYRIGESLGRGGMGSVFSGVHEKTGEKVAVKLIAQHVADEPRFRRRFDAEVETLQRLKHDGIVRLIGYGEEDGQLFYSMELVEGETLQARIRREKRLDWRTTLDVGIQICAALKHAHDIGVIHRDLKPANLVLTKEDKVKLVDFGIAKIFGGTEQTAAGSVLGTADYMAPEQATSSGTSARTDLYALGSLMYAMLTGRPPFTGKKITEVIESLKRDRPVPLDLVNPELPEDLVELVHQLLEKTPSDRPPTALAVMNRMKAMRAGLQREGTVVSDGLPTEVGRKTGGEYDTSPSGERDPSSATDVTSDKNQAPKRTIVSQGGAVVTEHGRASSPADATIVSRGSSKTVLPDGSNEEGEQERTHTKTHFQTVNESTATSGVFGSENELQEAGWVQWLSMAGMIGVLIFGAGLFYYAIQPPTADQLYAEAMENQDLDAMETFTWRFPEDERWGEVNNQKMEIKLRGILNRIEHMLADKSAAEAGFEFVMTGREQQPKLASIRIKKWLAVYDTPENGLVKGISEMVEHAKHEMTRLVERAPKIILDPRAKELIEIIQDSVENDDVETARQRLEGIIETHPDDWAKPAAEQARVHLELLTEFSDAKVREDSE